MTSRLVRRPLASVLLGAVVVTSLLGCTPDPVAPSTDSGESTGQATETRAAKIARCMEMEGWDVTYYPADDSFGGEMPANQADQYDASIVECEGRYPLTGPSSLDEYSDADWNQLYEDELARADCLREEGAEIPDAPSKAVFVDEYPSGEGWYAYGFVSPSEIGRDRWEELNQACPQS